MSEHQHQTLQEQDHHQPAPGMVRQCDVAVIGGSPAHLAAGLELLRHGRSAIVLDPATDDGRPGASDREEVRRHGGEVLAAQAEAVSRGDDGQLRVRLTGGHVVVCRRALDDIVPDGPQLGAVVAVELDAEDRRAGDRPSAQQVDWDQRYSGERLWSGNPNGALVAEVAGLEPGRALDVGAGEGGDALWLAEQGWDVTASDISTAALGHVDHEAGRRGLAVRTLHADANVPGALPSSAFDLVSAHYASIPRTPDDRATRNLLGAVAPGGVLLVVSHDLAPMRTPVDTAVQSRPFDPDAYVRVEDVAAALAESPAWEIEVHERRPRPAGAASSHHVDDLVLRARRLA